MKNFETIVETNGCCHRANEHLFCENCGRYVLPRFVLRAWGPQFIGYFEPAPKGALSIAEESGALSVLARKEK